MEITLLVLRERVTGQIPAVAHIGALPFVREIAAAGWSADREPADLAARFFFHVVVNDLGLVAADRLARRGGSRIVEPVGNKNVEHFGRADAVEDGLSSLFD